MSVQRGLWDDGAGRAENSPSAEDIRARIGREISYLLTISTEAGRAGRISPTGLSHSLSVCLIEDWHMSRSKGRAGTDSKGGVMPRFVDVKLTAEQRNEFQTWERRGGDLVTFMQSMADDGYRLGVSWSGEQQAYTVSITCRNPDSPNNGLCMTSFARVLSTALWLALYKHLEVTGERWVEGTYGESEDFG